MWNRISRFLIPRGDCFAMILPRQMQHLPAAGPKCAEHFDHRLINRLGPLRCTGDHQRFQFRFQTPIRHRRCPIRKMLQISADWTAGDDQFAPLAGRNMFCRFLELAKRLPHPRQQPPIGLAGNYIWIYQSRWNAMPRRQFHGNPRSVPTQSQHQRRAQIFQQRAEQPMRFSPGIPESKRPLRWNNRLRDRIKSGWLENHLIDRPAGRQKHRPRLRQNFPQRLSDGDTRIQMPARAAPCKKNDRSIRHQPSN